MKRNLNSEDAKTRTEFDRYTFRVLPRGRGWDAVEMIAFILGVAGGGALLFKLLVALPLRVFAPSLLIL